MSDLRTVEELAARWQVPAPGPGTVRLVCARLGDGVHRVLDQAEITVEAGLVGDRWRIEADPERDAQVTLMMASVVDVIGGTELPGDNLLVDLDLSEAVLPVGSRLQVGEAVLEVSAEPHLGCRKFAARFGTEALKWVNRRDNRPLRLRGVNCRVVRGGRVLPGDRVQRL